MGSTCGMAHGRHCTGVYARSLSLSLSSSAPLPLLHLSLLCLGSAGVGLALLRIGDDVFLLRSVAGAFVELPRYPAGALTWHGASSLGSPSRSSYSLPFSK